MSVLVSLALAQSTSIPICIYFHILLFMSVFRIFRNDNEFIILISIKMLLRLPILFLRTRNAYACIVAAALSYMVSFCCYFDFLFVFNHCLRDAVGIARMTKTEQLYTSRLEIEYARSVFHVQRCVHEARIQCRLPLCVICGIDGAK